VEELGRGRADMLLVAGMARVLVMVDWEDWRRVEFEPISSSILVFINQLEAQAFPFNVIGTNKRLLVYYFFINQLEYLQVHRIPAGGCRSGG